MTALYDPSHGSSDPLQSPCVRNCCLDDADVCLGCGRTLEEIRTWSAMSMTRRQEVLVLAADRQRQRRVPRP